MDAVPGQVGMTGTSLPISKGISHEPEGFIEHVSTDGIEHAPELQLEEAFWDASLGGIEVYPRPALTDPDATIRIKLLSKNAVFIFYI